MPDTYKKLMALSPQNMSDNHKDNIKDASNKPSLKASLPQKVESLITSEHRSYIIKKSERLASALYVVTGFMQSDEPMRKKLRAGSLDIIGLSTRPSGMSLEGIEKFNSICIEMGVLLTTARGAGLLSQMNAGLLSEEYALLAEFVSKNSQTLREGHTLAYEALSAPTAPIIESISNERTEPEEVVIKRQPTVKRQKDVVTETQSVSQSDRRNTILSLVDSKGKISIKDAVSLIPGVSEKTIQRELLAMVKDGVLLKEGERRWSTYMRSSIPMSL